MASGFGSFYGPDLNWADNTKACVWGKVYETVNSTNRTVTITVVARAAAVQRNVRRELQEDETIYGATGYRGFTQAKIGNDETDPNCVNVKNWGDNISLTANWHGWFEVGEYGYAGINWITGHGYYYATASRTYSYNDNGDAITDEWHAQFYTEFRGLEGSHIDAAFTTSSIEPKYTAPNTPTTSNLVSDGTANKAYSQVSTTGWGQLSSRARYEIVCDGMVKATNSEDDPASIYWTLPNYSTNTSACAINTWYGRAVNNHDLSSTSSAKYVATPSAPLLTISPATLAGGLPTTNVQARVTYGGGTQNSSTCDNGVVIYVQFGRLESTESGVPSSLTTIPAQNKTATYFWTSFPSGIDYKIYARAINRQGGSSSSTSQIIYCPQGVSGSLSSRTSTSLTLRASANTAGTINSSSGGSIAKYRIDWGDSETSLTHSTAIQAENVFVIDNLSPNQTIYYRVTAWNQYGLNNISNVMSATTIARYVPEVQLSLQANNGQISVQTAVVHTGGAVQDESPVTSLSFRKKAVNASSWTTVTTKTVNLSAGDTDTTTVWTQPQDTEGDYLIEVTASNGTDTSATQIRVLAPTAVTITSAKLATNEPIQISVTASTPTETYAPIGWELYNQTTNETHSLTSTGQSATILTHKHLLYDTQYQLKMKCINSAGLWRWSSVSTVTTAKRFEFYAVSGEVAKKGAGTVAKNGAEKQITEVYFITKDALGNVQSGDSVSGKTLKFITQPLHYRPENVKSITLSNGTEIRYDIYNNQYVFGIWSSDAPQTVFFDDNEGWRVTEYTFPSTTLTVSSASSQLNASAAFSTTKLIIKADWEE